MGKLNEETIKCIQENFKQLKKKCRENSADFISSNEDFNVLMELYNFLEDPSYQSKNSLVNDELIVLQFINENGYMDPLIREELINMHITGEN